MTLGEGGTPLEEVPALAAALGLARLRLKREDRNPTGSHKDRGMAFQVSALRAESPALRWLVVSSSGNAAVSAAAMCAAAGLRLLAFVAPGTEPAKLALAHAAGALLLETPRALTLAAAVADARGLPNLRPSVDPLAVPGFETLAFELAAEAPDAPAVFTFASSAASLVGMGRGARAAGWRPAWHVVQGAGAAPVAGPFDPRPAPPGARVGALGARKTRRLGEAARLVRTSGGRGWVVGDDEADAAAAQLAAHGVDAALEAAAALAAAGRAAREAGVRDAIVVITGARRAAPRAAEVARLAAMRARPRDLPAALAALDAADDAAVPGVAEAAARDPEAAARDAPPGAPR